MQPTYTPADAAYMAKRGLRRYAGAWHLWAMGVGAVISGDFFGWNYGLTAGGFGGMMLAVSVMTAMYIGLCFSIAEMSAALPHAFGNLGLWVGGAYALMQIGRTAFMVAALPAGPLRSNFERIEVWCVVSGARGRRRARARARPGAALAAGGRGGHPRRRRRVRDPAAGAVAHG